MAPMMAPDVAPLFKDRTLNSPSPRKRVNPIAIVLVLVMVALIFGGIAKNMLKAKEQPLTTTVIAAGADLAPGSRLGFQSLHKIEIPNQYLTASMFTGSEQIVGRTTRLFLQQGEPITNEALFRGMAGLAGSLETHERAVTLRLDDEGLIDHSVYPGDYVDVIATTTKDGKKCTKTICQEVRVLLSLTKDGTNVKSGRITDGNRITLACTPEQSELVSQAAESGKIRLALRSKLSRKVNKLDGVVEDDLFPAKAFIKPLPPVSVLAPQFAQMMPPPPPSVPVLPQGAPQAVAAAPNPLEWIVEVFSGSKKETYAFPESTR